jgi:hypothetical protein
VSGFRKQGLGKRARAQRRYLHFARTGEITVLPGRRLNMGIKLVKNKQDMEDIFGDPLTVSFKDDVGETAKSGSGLVEILTLFIRNLGNFYGQDQKPMPFSDSEHAFAVAQAIRGVKNGVIEIYDDDHTWLIKIVEQMGTRFIGDDAVVLKKALENVKEPKDAKAETPA